MAFTPSENVRRIIKFFAFSGAIPVNTDIAFWNAGCDTIKRRTEPHTDIFLAQNFRHSDCLLYTSDAADD